MSTIALGMAAQALCAPACAAVDSTDWAAFGAGDRVEVDAACTGNWRRAAIGSIGIDPYNAKARRFTVKREDGSDWTFSAPGIVAPCMRALGAVAALPVRPTGPPQPLQGLYLQLQSTGTSYAYIHYYFWKDGRYCQGLPTGGIDREPADFDALQRGLACGHYRMSTGQISLQMQGQDRPSDMSLRNLRSDSFEMNGYATAKVAAFPADKPIDGRFTATVQSQQATTQVYAFHPDGHFEFGSMPVTSRDGAPRTDAGTYRLNGNTLQLTGGHGVDRHTIYPLPNGSLMIAGAVFAR